MYKFEKEVRQRAEKYILSLKKNGITGEIVKDSFRDYTVKVFIEKDGNKFGHVNLYYSPRRDLYTFKSHELKDKSILSELELCWYGRNIVPVQSKGYEIYVDGSFFNGATGYGAVILKDGTVVDELSGSVSDSQGTHQVAGELLAVQKSIEWCQNNSIPKISIFYDYEGIEKWVTGEWMAKQPLTQAYAMFVRNSNIDISWHKVESHTGNKWNDRADELARKGALKSEG